MEGALIVLPEECFALKRGTFLDTAIKYRNDPPKAKLIWLGENNVL